VVKPHVCHVFPAFGNGGPEVRTAIIINATADRFRHTVLSISGERSGEPRLRPDGGTRFECVPRRAAWGAYPRVLARMLRDLRPDLVLTYGWGGVDAILASRMCGLRRIIHAEDGFLPDEAARQKWHRLLIRRILLRAASRVVFPSRTLMGIAERLWRLPQGKLQYVPNGVDASRFSPGTLAERTAARRRFGWCEDDVVIGTVGHLRAEKNHARLIRAFSQLAADRRCTLLIVGDGNLRQDLERQVHALGLADRVVFTGIVLDPLDCYRAMDLLALSSDTEQMPFAVLEAMSTGLPIVSTAVGDVPHMVVAENRPFVTPLGDEPAYMRALSTLVHGTEERMALGRLNRSRCVATYDVGAMIDAYRDLYTQVIGRTLEPS
jgi:glycosyltransferase involved in cell wall biosynthesis